MEPHLSASPGAVATPGALVVGLLEPGRFFKIQSAAADYGGESSIRIAGRGGHVW